MNYIGPIIEHRVTAHETRIQQIPRTSRSLQCSSVDYHTNGDELSDVPNQAIQS